MRDVKLIAFHLTQFHPIPENDAWWGEGFTEWTNVRRAQPAYPGHRQPQLPGELGFYDLRDEDARDAQAALAREYGVDAFCFYYYWFGGKRLLERPVEAMLGGGAPQFPFCLCWANENWTRRWDGKDNEILIAQQHSTEDDVAMARDLIRHFRDPRYLRVDGKPLMIVYRTDLLPDPQATVARWREECRRAGIGEIHLCMTRRFDMRPRGMAGFDAIVDFPPLGHVAAELTRAMPGLDANFRGRIFDYRDLMRDAIQRLRNRKASLPNYPAVTPSWDNSARKGVAAHVYHGATPLQYRAWLAEAVRAAVDDVRLEQPFVFINAWNEWAEGCHLEPDKVYGNAWLEATRAAKNDATHDARLWQLYGARQPVLPPALEKKLAGATLAQIEAEMPAPGGQGVHPTFYERLIAFLRRRVEVSPTLRRLVLPVARRVGLAD